MKLGMNSVACTLLSLFLFPPVSASAQETRSVDDGPSRSVKNWRVPFEKFQRADPDSHSISPDVTGPPASHFITVAPCRVVDTRFADAPYAGPNFTPGLTRSFSIPGSPCSGIPAAVAYSLSFAVVGFSSGGGFVTAYPTGTTRPNVATVDFGTDPSIAVANAAIVPASSLGSIDVYSSGNTSLIIDINGYFAAGVVTSVTAGTGLSGGGVGNVSLSVANGGIGPVQLSAAGSTPSQVLTSSGSAVSWQNAPTGATGTTGATGATGATGVTGVTGATPVAVSGFSSASPSNLPASGAEFYRFVTPSFVVPAGVTRCMVTSTVQTNPVAAAPNNAVYFRNAISRDSVNSEDGFFGHYLYNDGAGRLQPDATRSSQFTVTAGQSIVFGMYFGALINGTAWYNTPVSITTSYFCF